MNSQKTTSTNESSRNIFKLLAKYINQYPTVSKEDQNIYLTKTFPNLITAAKDKKVNQFNDTDENGETLAHIAVRANAPAILKLLCDAGIDLSKKNLSTLTRLKDKKGVEVKKGVYGITPIELAAENTHWNCVYTILNHQCYNTYEQSGPSVYNHILYYAAKDNHTGISELCIKKINVSTPTSLKLENNGYNALHFAVINNNLTLCQSLVSSNMPFKDEKDSKGRTPAKLATELNHTDCFTIINSAFVPVTKPLVPAKNPRLKPESLTWLSKLQMLTLYQASLGKINDKNIEHEYFQFHKLGDVIFSYILYLAFNEQFNERKPNHVITKTLSSEIEVPTKNKTIKQIKTTPYNLFGFDITVLDFEIKFKKFNTKVAAFIKDFNKVTPNKSLTSDTFVTKINNIQVGNATPSYTFFYIPELWQWDKTVVPTGKTNLQMIIDLLPKFIRYAYILTKDTLYFIYKNNEKTFLRNVINPTKLAELKRTLNLVEPREQLSAHQEKKKLGLVNSAVGLFKGDNKVDRNLKDDIFIMSRIINQKEYKYYGLKIRELSIKELNDLSKITETTPPKMKMTSAEKMAAIEEEIHEFVHNTKYHYDPKKTRTLDLLEKSGLYSPSTNLTHVIISSARNHIYNAEESKGKLLCLEDDELDQELRGENVSNNNINDNTSLDSVSIERDEGTLRISNMKNSQ